MLRLKDRKCSWYAISITHYNCFARKIFTLFFVTLLYGFSYAQNYETKFSVLFPINGSTLYPDYQTNNYSIEEMKLFFNKVEISAIDSVKIVGSSSPEGPDKFNSFLNIKRAESLRNYISSTFYVPYSKIYLSSKYENLSDQLKLSYNLPDKEQVLLIFNSGGTFLERLNRIRDLGYQKSYEYICDKIIPIMRNASAVVVYYNNDQHLAFEYNFDSKGSKSMIVPPDNAEPSLKFSTRPSAADSMVSSRTIESEESFILYPVKLQRPLFALKTNLLYDVATLVNISLEVPIGNNVSIAGEFIFPWWLNEKRQNALQAYSANLEVKYWFKPLLNKNNGKFSTMTGWFLGAYAGAGIYDIEYQGKGYQGEFLLSAGLMGGYAHSIGKSLRMEYSLGVGYMETNYRHYQAKVSPESGDWKLYRVDSGKWSWIGPTQLKISLVWMLSRNVKR